MSLLISGLPRRPWPVLTAIQCRDAQATLRAYLGGPYGRGEVYLCPMYVPRELRYPADDLPDSYISEKVGRTAKGRAGDPTFGAVAEAVMGPRMVVLRVPHYEHLPYATLRLLVQRTLPAHLAEPLAWAVIRRKGSIVAGLELHVSRSTIERRCDEALAALCRSLYGPRWPADRAEDIAIPAGSLQMG